MMKIFAAFIKKYERYISLWAVAIGFLVDSLTLPRIDALAGHLVFIAYLVIAGLGIFCIHHVNLKIPVWLRSVLPIVVQFILGALFSGFIVIYGRSASLHSGWFFVLLLVILMVGNEFFRHMYDKATFHLPLLFLSLYSYIIFLMPIFFKSRGWFPFIVSGILSLALMYLFIKAIFKIAPSVRAHEVKIKLLILGIFVIMQLMFIFKVLPPVPLSLKDIGIYHSIDIAKGTYTLVEENQPWYSFMYLYPRYTVTATNTRAYVYNAVFAPTGFEQELFHSWQIYDEKSGSWQARGVVPFEITGGKDIGYRFYTYHSALTPGFWKVEVLTPRDEVLGSIKFVVQEDEEYKTRAVQR